jgi:hypothetical protein
VAGPLELIALLTPDAPIGRRPDEHRQPIAAEQHSAIRQPSQLREDDLASGSLLVELANRDHALNLGDEVVLVESEQIDSIASAISSFVVDDSEPSATAARCIRPNPSHTSGNASRNDAVGSRRSAMTSL